MQETQHLAPFLLRAKQADEVSRPRVEEHARSELGVPHFAARFKAIEAKGEVAKGEGRRHAAVCKQQAEKAEKASAAGRVELSSRARSIEDTLRLEQAKIERSVAHSQRKRKASTDDPMLLLKGILGRYS